MPSSFPRDRYDARRGEVLLHMSHFFLGYLNCLYEQFDGDLAMVIVLGEISHHNTAKAFSPEELCNERMHRIQHQDEAWEAMEGCNAFSVSCATRIPRETVRRKIVELKKRGWVEDVPGKGLRITRACGNHFGPDFSLTILDKLLKAARAIESVLGIRGTGAPAAAAKVCEPAASPRAANAARVSSSPPSRKVTRKPKPSEQP